MLLVCMCIWLRLMWLIDPSHSLGHATKNLSFCICYFAGLNLSSFLIGIRMIRQALHCLCGVQLPCCLCCIFLQVYCPTLQIILFENRICRITNNKGITWDLCCIFSRWTFLSCFQLWGKIYGDCLIIYSVGYKIKSLAMQS